MFAARRPLILAALAIAALTPFISHAQPPAPRPAAIAPTVTPDSLRLGHAVEPLSESLHLILDADKPDYTGTARFALKVNSATRTIRFHARELTIDKATLTAKAGAVAVSAAKTRSDMVTLTAAKALAPGAYTLTLEFHNRFNTRAAALYRMQTGGHGYLFTQFESTEAREAFPCWDEPEFKIPWDMTLVVPEKHLAIANTPILREAPAANGMKAVTFKRTRPLPSYLIAIATGPLETVDVKGMSVPGRIVTVQGATALAKEAATITPPLLKALEEYFGRPYPYEKLDQIAAPEFLYGAMENAGAIIYADRALLLDSRTVGPEQRRRLGGIIAHECAHMWFGDLVTMKWWDDLWLNESFANWMGARAMDRVFPEFHGGLRSLEGAQTAMSTDGRISTRAMRQPITAAENLDQAADELAYNKGEAVLDMFEGWLGPDTMRAGVLSYLKAHEWGNATGDELWKALSKASGQNINAAMSSFLDQPGVPLVSCEVTQNTKVRLSQRRCLDFGVTEARPTRWRVPVVIAYGMGTQVLTKKVWLGDSTEIVDLGIDRSPNWIFPNAGATGYYRWELPMSALEELATRGSVVLSPRERIGYILNLGALLRAGVIHGHEFLSLLKRFSDETEPEVVSAMLRMLGEIREPLVSKASEPAFAAYLHQTLGPALERFGRLPSPGEPPAVTLMRPQLLAVLGDAGRDASVIAFAESLGAAYRADPNAIDPSLVEPAIMLAALHGNRALFDDYKHRFENSHTPAERTLFLAALGAFRDTALVAEGLRYSLGGSLRPQEIFAIPRVLAMYEPNRDQVFDWLMDFYPRVAAFVPPHFAIRFANFGGGCSAERLERARTFFLDPKRNLPGMDHELDKIADRVHECLSLADHDGPQVAAYLKAFGSGE